MPRSASCRCRDARLLGDSLMLYLNRRTATYIERWLHDIDATGPSEDAVQMRSARSPMRRFSRVSRRGFTGATAGVICRQCAPRET